LYGIFAKLKKIIMGRFNVGDKVVYNGRENKVEGKREDFGNKTVAYFLAGVENPVNDAELSPLFIEKKPTNKQAEFAKKLISTEK
jgi:hypothetical protein